MTGTATEAAATDNIKIIAHVGDTDSLKSEDMGKRFIRLGMSEENPEVIQGRFQTEPIYARTGVDWVFAAFGLLLFDPDDDYIPAMTDTSYFITGAIVYGIHEDQAETGLFGILASIREVPSGHHPVTYADSEFDRQYPLLETEPEEGGFPHEKRDDNSIASELDEILAEYCRQRDAAYEAEDLAKARTERIRELTAREGSLNAQERAELNRLRNAQRIAEAEMEAAWRADARDA